MSAPLWQDGSGYPDDEDQDDSHQQLKDDHAMGYADRDGKQLDPPEPDWSQR